MKTILSNLRFFIFSFTFFSDEDQFYLENDKRKVKKDKLLESLFMKAIFYTIYSILVIISPFSQYIYDALSKKSWATGKCFLNKVNFKEDRPSFLKNKKEYSQYIKKNLWNIVGSFFTLKILVISTNKFVLSDLSY